MIAIIAPQGDTLSKVLNTTEFDGKLAENETIGIRVRAQDNREGLLFRKGEIVCKLPEENLLDALREELDRIRTSR